MIKDISFLQPVFKKKLGNDLLEFLPGQLGIALIKIESSSIKEAIQILLDNVKDTTVCAISGVDVGSNIRLLYHVRANNSIVTIQTEVSKENPKIASITNIIPAANFHEREANDLFGAVFEGHPSPGRLVLPDRWPEGIYPLRKDVKANEVKLNPETTKVESNDSSDSKLVNIIIGPQHPALLESEKFTVSVDGETVKQVIPRLGYIHRGVEKAAEGHTYLQDVYLTERICGICNSCHSTTFIGAVEKILATQVPERAKYLRVIILELNRLHSHLLLLGHAGLEIGYEALFQYMWRDREPIMDLTEMVSGNRVITSSITIGGVRRDITDAQIPKIKSTLATLQTQMGLYQKLYETEPSIRMRTKNVGVLTREDAIKLGVVGPIARASGVVTDVRKDAPYEAYGEIPFEVITREAGDTLSRFLVRVDEITESIKIINYAVDHLPAGPYRVKVPRVVVAGEAINRVEAPRGELIHYVKSNGTAYPERVKVRTPTFANLPSFLKTAIGGSIADVPANFVSLDPCFSCTDR
jgi:formate hydrogenlyase subunit 5